MFSIPKYISNSFSVIFSRQLDIRRKANILEDKLKGNYSQPQIFSIPDDMDAEVPRVIFDSRHGYSQIAFSQVSCSLNVVYSPDWQMDISRGRDYLLERSSLLFDLLRIAGINKVFFSGLITQVNIPSDETENTIIDHVARKFLRNDETNELHDIEIKETKIVDDKFFSNVVIANYRSWAMDTLPVGVLNLSRSKTSERGVRIICDFNDRYSYNEIEGYTSKKSLMNTVISRGLETAQITVDSIRNIV